MTHFKEELLSVLNEIKGSGTFVSSAVKPFHFPGLKIQGVDEIGFPINAVQIKEMIKAAHKAPFGKGSKTLLDTTVRSAWEIDAEKIAFTNSDWGKFVESIVKQIKPDLGIEEHSVNANLYKLLIYEQGDFFVAHKDSEKEKGMFGTLIINLPSRHTGGELVVKFDGREETIDFSGPADQYKIPFAAFYADCEHEIKPVISGYRVCLVYNLIQTKGTEKIAHNPLDGYIQRLSVILRGGEEDRDIPKIVLLGHQYTPSNFTMESLKLNDRPKAETLIQAAEKAGFYSKLGLVTSHQMGSLEIVSKKSSRSSAKRRYYDDDDFFDEEDLENGIMGEVYDEQIDIEHWMDEGVPPLRDLEIEEENLISGFALNEGEPIQKQAEGFTGNAGMEMDYWYHYGAVFLWPKKYHYELLVDLKPANKLEWIDYYNKHWKDLGTADREVAGQLAESGLHEERGRATIDFTPLVQWLINLDDHEYLSKRAPLFLTDCFELISVDGWVKLFEKYPYSFFEKIFETVEKTGDIGTVRHILAILTNLSANEAHLYDVFILDRLAQMPARLNALELYGNDSKSKAKDVLKSALELGKLKTADGQWLKNTTDAFTGELTREYVNDILVATILERGLKTPLANQIMAVCKHDLVNRVDAMPQPPPDWVRAVPTASSYYKKVWAILTDFLQSPSQQVFNYTKVQNERSEMENAIAHVTIDLKTETIRKGSPHTLRLTKTQGAYERDLADWKIDVSLLGKVEKW